ncbi:hypothetical protein [Lysinibacillus sp. JNUCC-52]|uniref:hypothetical protein n=1 Tax=Lysinibacillus sp. JNUCC-52 TaxID=2792480 RepID=UPI0019387DC3|nr:hypothetical protein JNUCC52_02960 [Lysinibacillus sp. JNUCC-52]
MIERCNLYSLEIETIGQYTSKISSEAAFFRCDTRITVEYSTGETRVIQGNLTQKDIKALNFVLTKIFGYVESKEHLKYNGKSIIMDLDTANPKKSTYTFE